MSRNQRIVIALAAARVLAAFLKEPMGEQRYLWNLHSEDATEWPEAALKLGDMRSLRAISRLIEILRLTAVNGDNRLVQHPGSFQRQLHYGASALVKVGAPAIVPLVDGLAHWPSPYLSGSLCSIGPPRASDVLTLK